VEYKRCNDGEENSPEMMASPSPLFEENSVCFLSQNEIKASSFSHFGIKYF